MGLDISIDYENGECFAYFGTDGAFVENLLTKEEQETFDCIKRVTAKQLKEVMLTFVKETIGGFSENFDSWDINKEKYLYIDRYNEYSYRMMALPKVLARLSELKAINENIIFVINYSG